jgi:predicted nucleic acid-binding protein
LIAPDSSVVVAALAPWHTGHAAAREALRSSQARLVAHVAFETTSALSRMPQGLRIAPVVVLDAIVRRFPDRWLALDAGHARAALEQAVEAGVRGGALYDALIAATAAHHGARVVSADRRAGRAYEAVGADVIYVDV